jgi:hypothetical protein
MPEELRHDAMALQIGILGYLRQPMGDYITALVSVGGRTEGCQ